MRQAYLLLTPALLLLLAITACLALLVVISFWTQDYLDLAPRWSLESYASLLRSPIFSRLMLRSAAISALVTVASLLIAFPMAYVVAFDVAGSKLAWLLVFTLPCWISYLLRILSWKLILGYQGLLNMTLMQLGLSDRPLEFLLYNPTSVTIALVQAWAPFALLPIYVSLDKIDRSLLQAAADLGDGPFRIFLRVTLPLSMPGVAGAALLIFIPTFGDYVTPQLLGGPSGAMIGSFIASQFGPSNNWPLGSAASLLAMIAATLGVSASLAGFHRLLRLFR